MMARAERVSASRAGPAQAVPGFVREALSGPGQSLEVGTRREMESRFGHDFSRVRIHDGNAAAAAASVLGAAAYTVGHDIALGRAAPASGTTDGRALLAHELAHVVQQERGGGTNPPTGASSPHERDADAAGRLATSATGRLEVATKTGVGLACAPEHQFAGADRKGSGRQAVKAAPPPVQLFTFPHQARWLLLFATWVFQQELEDWIFLSGKTPEGFILNSGPFGGNLDTRWYLSWTDWKVGIPRSFDRLMEFQKLLTPYGRSLANWALEGGSMTDEEAFHAQSERQEDMHRRIEYDAQYVPTLGMTRGQAFSRLKWGVYELNGTFVWIGKKNARTPAAIEVYPLSPTNENFNQDMRWYLRHGLSVNDAVAAYSAHWDDIFALEITLAGTGAGYRLPEAEVAQESENEAGVLERRFAKSQGVFSEGDLMFAQALSAPESVTIRTELVEEVGTLSERESIAAPRMTTGSAVKPSSQVRDAGELRVPPANDNAGDDIAIARQKRIRMGIVPHQEQDLETQAKEEQTELTGTDNSEFRAVSVASAPPQAPQRPVAIKTGQKPRSVKPAPTKPVVPKSTRPSSSKKALTRRSNLMSLGNRRANGSTWFLKDADLADVANSTEGHQVYEYWAKDECLYVGKSGGLEGKKPNSWINRGWDHLKEKPAISEADTVIVTARLSPDEASAIEANKIRIYKPRLNVKKEVDFLQRDALIKTPRAKTYRFINEMTPALGGLKGED